MSQNDSMIDRMEEKTNRLHEVRPGLHDVERLGVGMPPAPFRRLSLA